MENNHTVHSFKFDLLQLGKQKHTEVEQRVIRTFNQSFYRIINRISDQFAKDEDIAISQLALDLGDISEEELERQLPRKFEEALLDYFIKRKRQIENQKGKEEDQEKERLHPLLYYLSQGIYPWYAPQQESFSFAWEKSILAKSFKHCIYQFTWPQRAIKRLVHLGFEQLLKKTVTALVPNEASFIFDYHEELLNRHEQGELQQNESRRSFHLMIWEFTLQYIFNAKGSRFSRKQFVMSQIASIANHYNIRFADFLELFFRGIKELKVQNQHRKELYSILTELREEYEKDKVSSPELSDKRELLETVLLLSIHDVERLLKVKQRSNIQTLQLKEWLSKKRNLERIKQNWLNPLKENILYESLSVLVGDESKEQIKDYHELLWEQKIATEGKPILSAYKQAVWEFTLDFFAQSFSSYFQAKEFIRFHTKKMAQRYNFSLFIFLNSLVASIERMGERRTHFQFLAKVLLAVYEEENVNSYISKGAQDQLIDELLNQAISEYHARTFHSEREVYFFLEQWGIRILNRTNTLSNLPISYMLSLLKFRNKVSSTFFKALTHHQQYELAYQHIQKRPLDKNDAPDKLINTFNEIVELNGFIAGHKKLSFQLLLKILHHQQQVSYALVEKLRFALNQAQLQEKLMIKWVLKLNYSQVNRLFKLLFPNSEFLIEIHTILYYSIKMNKGDMVSLLLKQSFKWANKLNDQKYWQALLTEFAKETKTSLEDLKNKVLEKLVEMLIQKPEFVAHYNYLTDKKQYFGIESTREREYNSQDFSLELFFKLSQEEWASFSETQRREWNNFLSRMLLKQPELWIKEFFSKSDLASLELEKYIGLSPLVKNLFLLRLNQWKQIENIVSDQVKKQGRIDQFIRFFVRFEEGDYLQLENFLLWSDQEIKLLYVFLGDKNRLKKWLYLGQAEKVKFLKRSITLEQDLFISCYMKLELIYKEIPINCRPYTFREFELSFWSLVLLGMKQKWSVWKILEKWIIYAYRSLGVDISTYGDLRDQLKSYSLEKWQKVEEAIDREGVKNEIIESELENVEKEDEVITLDKWELHHVGLVIVHPFLKRLFQALSYINDKGGFKNKQTQTRAIAILHYLATGAKYGEDSLEEHLLAFPKLLCGMPIAELVDNSLVLETKELEMADDMLKACMQHWEKLKGTSIDGLRNTFLKRKGRIEEKDSAYQLYVESSGTDVLLDFLPWSISLIRLPWLELPIYVSWR